MKTRWIAALVIVLGLIAVRPDTAGAGAGGPGAPVPIVLLNCYMLENTANTGFVLEVNDQFGTQQHTRLGKATLVCTRTITTDTVNGATVEQGGKFNPDFALALSQGLKADHLKCYDVPNSSGPVGDSVKVIDIFGTDTTDAMQLSVVCAPAVKVVIP